MSPEESARERQILLSILNDIREQEDFVTLHLPDGEIFFGRILHSEGDFYYCSGAGVWLDKTFDFELDDILAINISTVPPFSISLDIQVGIN